jgi:chromosome partitioning protein
MRIDGRTSAAETLALWSQGLQVPYIGSLRETQLYVKSLERGLTIFDLPPHKVAADLAEWRPIIDWLRPVLQPPQAANDAPGEVREVPSRIRTSRPDSLMPAQESMLPGSRLNVLATQRAAMGAYHAPVRTLPRMAAEGPELPQLLKR